MVQQQQSPIAVEANFTGGLKTEFTGLNFPENACTETQNCVFSLIGDVFRREGIDYEANFNLVSIPRVNAAVSSYKWNNAGGDGSTQVIVLQVGGTLYFFRSSSAITTAPLSTTQLVSTVTLSNFIPSGGSAPDTLECNFTDGNGYLFVFHPRLESFYCTYNNGTITAASINIQIRDFTGLPENIPDNVRPSFGPVPNNDHIYNLQNQGWVSSSPWAAVSSSLLSLTGTGSYSFSVPAGLPVTLGVSVNVTGFLFSGGVNTNIPLTMSGIVNFYSGNTITVNVSSFSGFVITSPPGVGGQWTITPTSSTGQIATWESAIGNFPSNADVWWTFKNTSNVFDPATTINSVTLGSGPAPKGFYILSAFNQNRAAVSGVQFLSTPVLSTTVRPKTGTWFQGRVWYTGVDAAFPTGNNPTSWSESLYFSQIVVTPAQFGRCYQTNDPTSETLFDLLPTDGGTISIPGSGSIYRLFPIQSGMLVFAANGVWYLTGSTGIGFAANDYTITKISGVQSISRHSYINVQGLPVFWNEEGIYAVEPAKAGSGNRTNEQETLTVNPLTLGTILSFYNEIPLQSKKFARGDYNPITYIVKWVYKSNNETDVTSRYQFDSILNFNIANKAFYPYTIAGTPTINGVVYVAGPGGSTSPEPTFKYIVSANSKVTFAEERDSSFVDWKSFDNVGTNYISDFITGYRLTGQAMMKFQPQYIRIFTRNDTSTAYKIQAIWDYATDPNSGRYSTEQIINSFTSTYNKLFRKIKLRGHGVALQIKVTSIDGQPFDIMGWSVINEVDQGV